MIYFILGLATGAAMSYGSLVLAFLLMPRVKHYAREAREKYVEKESIGTFIEPPSSVSDALNEIFDRNASEGKDTNISDLL